MTQSRISVIIPVWNDPEQLARCLTALKAQSIPTRWFDIVVVDNGSTDNTAEVARSFGAAVLYEPTPGSYAARNTALAYAQSQYVAFTDADCVPDPCWLEVALAAAMNDPSIGLVTGPIKLFEPDTKGWTSLRDYETLFSFPQNISTGSIATANWFCPRSLLEKLGGFDQIAKSGGDKLLALSIRDSGAKIVFAPGAIVRHPVRSTPVAIIAKRRRLIGGRWRRIRGKMPYLHGVFFAFQNFAGRSRRAFFSKPLDLTSRLKVVLVIACILVIDVFEFTRLALGAKPIR